MSESRNDRLPNPGFFRTAFLIIGFASALAGCVAGSSEWLTSAQGESASPPALLEGWQEVKPGGDTQCSDGSDYAFYTRNGDPDKLLFFLQGGGACWNLQTCDPLGKPSYTVNLEGFHPSQADGIFNFERLDNPLADHTVVFVPYCSADVHIGDAVIKYKRPADWITSIKSAKPSVAAIPPEFTITHKGLANARAALEWVGNNVSSPESVMVAGSSAGSIPSPYYAVHLASAFPDARVSQLGDGSGGYRQIGQSASPQVAWRTVPALSAEPTFAALSDDDFTFEKLYVLAHAAQPRVRLHAYDTAEDDVQLQFLALSGLRVDSLREAIALNQAGIREAVPSFQSFVAAGELHTILRRPEFYTYAVGERRVRDWLADIVAGRQVSSVSCRECSGEAVAH